MNGDKFIGYDDGRYEYTSNPYSTITRSTSGNRPLDQAMVEAIENLQSEVASLKADIMNQESRQQIMENDIKLLRDDMSRTNQDLRAVEAELKISHDKAAEVEEKNHILEVQNREYIADYEDLQGETESLYAARERMKKIVGQEFLRPEQIEQLKQELKIIP